MRDATTIGMVGIMGAMFLAGCATPKFGTPSGRPEVTIAAPRAAVRSALVNILVGQGLGLVSEAESFVQAEGKMSFGERLLMSNRFGEQPRLMYRFTILEVPAGTRVIGQPFNVVPGMIVASEVDLTEWKDGDYVMSILNCIEPNLKRFDATSKTQRSATPPGLDFVR